MGAVKDSYGAAPFLQIPVGDGSQLRVPKAFYHYTERDLGADAGWGVPSDGRLMALNTLVKNNRKEINGVYLPFPNMDPINLHFISQKICRISSEVECEEALLHYHRTKANALRQQSKPLHQQLLNLSDLTSYSTLRDREGGGLGVVVGVPGYDPLYVGAALDANKDAKLGLRFSPPE
ncbi:unnamed protein product [Cylicostephanus goldi]|uniref:Uncharacterized protein n=1 Tax=Cylicostephanus goldi TaxID=71465 RepID=A0A3P6QNA4_CYLGO|nr:unnamed protein product [Cylicostephanus goldi]